MKLPTCRHCGQPLVDGEYGGYLHHTGEFYCRAATHAEPQWDGPFCEDTGERAVQGTCPTHGGDACLKMRGEKPPDDAWENARGVLPQPSELPEDRQRELREAEAAARDFFQKQGGDTRVEWGLRHVCEMNGCDPVHSDDGRVFSFDYEVPRGTRGKFYMNNYLCQRVSRTVTYGTWEEA